MAAALSAISDNIHFAQTDLVNWTLVSDDSGVILIDAGFPGQRDDVLRSLRDLGFETGDVRAILLTHAHVDHLGSAIWFAKPMGRRCSATAPRSAMPNASFWNRFHRRICWRAPGTRGTWPGP